MSAVSIVHRYMSHKHTRQLWQYNGTGFVTYHTAPCLPRGCVDLVYYKDLIVAAISPQRLVIEAWNVLRMWGKCATHDTD